MRQKSKLIIALLLFAICASGAELRKEAEASLKKGVAFFYTINAHGGYVYNVTPDLSLRWGEGQKDEHTIEVQPPGNPAVGQSFLRAFLVTGNEQALNFAKEAAYALIRGQNKFGGWEHTINSEYSVSGFLEAKKEKNKLPRLLVLTDIGDDPDDEQSLVRLLVYANKFEIEGFVTERWWKDTHNGRHGVLSSDNQMKLLHQALDLYEKVRPNLERHEKGYPTAEALHKIVKRGKVNVEMTLSAPKGDPLQWIGLGKDTEGSDYIIEVVDRDDSRPVDICVWGGTADLAQALLRVRNERTVAEVDEFVSRIRVHAISDQDDTGPWIRENFPKLFFILDHDPNGDKWESCYRGMFYGGDESLTTLDWLNEFVRRNHGPLGEFYPQKTNTNKNPHCALKEGDTPSWFFFYPNGLNIPDHPEYGGWGGRYKYNGTFWQDAADNVDGHPSGRASVYRWRPDFQNDFAARMDWCVKDYSEANHAPVVQVKSEQLRFVKPGETVKLVANASDPDGNKLTYKWWQYTDASTVETNVTIANNETPDQASFVMPNEPGKQIHIILKVSDNGTPSLVAYQRIVFNIKP